MIQLQNMILTCSLETEEEAARDDTKKKKNQILTNTT